MKEDYMSMSQLPIKDKLASFLRLADNASERVRKREAITWNLWVALWIACGVGAGLVTSSGRTLSLGQAVALVGLMLFALAICVVLATAMERANRFDGKYVAQWLTEVENAIRRQPPGDLGEDNGEPSWEELLQDHRVFLGAVDDHRLVRCFVCYRGHWSPVTIDKEEVSD